MTSHDKTPRQYTFNVHWSPEDGEWVGTCPAFPSMSFMGGDSQAFALLGIAELAHEAVADGAYGDIQAAVDEASVPSIRAQVLREAEKLVCGDREDQYGSPAVNLQRIAHYWNTYLADVEGPLMPRDVALMMVLMKVAREANGHKRDSMVDIAGYAAIGAEAA